MESIRDEAGNEWPQSKTYSSQRLSLHYLDWGNEEAPLLILVHGGRDHAHSWDWSAHSLRKYYHVIALDLRGHGDSDWSPGSMYSVIDSVLDLSCLLDDLGANSAKLIGHSYGGAVVALFAGIYPEKVSQLVIIEGLGVPLRMLQEAREESAWTRIQNWVKKSKGYARHRSRQYPTVEEAVVRMKSANEHLSAEQAEHLTVHGLRKNENDTYTWKYDPLSRVLSPLRYTEEELQDLRSRIDCPTLLMHGLESWAGDPLEDGRGEVIRHARSVGIAEAGHWLHHDRLELFLETVEGFLRETG
jgi:pimeloyl-ACP methyl ester carboxylesterase